MTTEIVSNYKSASAESKRSRCILYPKILHHCCCCSSNGGRRDDTLSSARRHSSTEDLYDIQDDEATLQFNVEAEAKEMTALVVSTSLLAC